MNLENVGISYNASYLLQGNQIERCKKSIDLNVKVTELLLRTDKKDCDIDNIKKVYKGKVLFHVPAINPDLANLKSVNELVRTLSENGIKMITINASNLSLDLFEWSTLEEQKKYFLNIVTAIATLASNKIEVAIDNLKHNESNTMFGSDIAQVTDIIVYSRKMLVKDFGFKEDVAEKYIGLSLNIDNIDVSSDKENLNNWFEVFNNSIKCIKISNLDNEKNIKLITDMCKKNNYIVLLKTESDIDEVDEQFVLLLNLMGVDINVIKESTIKTKIKDNSKNNKKITNMIIALMIITTIIILCMMFILELR
nr:MAG TPA: hypothetical protein [Caudoviricetes sp.]